MKLESVFSEENQENNTDELVSRMLGDSANFALNFNAIFAESQKHKADTLEDSDSGETPTSSDGPSVRRPKKPIKAPREQSADPRAAIFSQKEDGIYMNAEFKNWETFYEKFRRWMVKHNQPFRISSSDKFGNGDGSINDAIGYRSIVYHCPRYGEKRVRGEGKRIKREHYLPCRCTAAIRLNYHNASQVLRITTFRPLHNHDLSAEEFLRLTTKRGQKSSGPTSPLSVQASSSGVSSNDTSPAGTLSPVPCSPAEMPGPMIQPGLALNLSDLLGSAHQETNGLDHLNLLMNPSLELANSLMNSQAYKEEEYQSLGEFSNPPEPVQENTNPPALSPIQSGPEEGPSPVNEGDVRPDNDLISGTGISASQSADPEVEQRPAKAKRKAAKKDPNNNISKSKQLEDSKIAAEVASQWMKAAIAMQLEKKKAASQPPPPPIQRPASPKPQTNLMNLLLHNTDQLKKLIEAENQRRAALKQQEQLANLQKYVSQQPSLANLLAMASVLKQNGMGGTSNNLNVPFPASSQPLTSMDNTQDVLGRLLASSSGYNNQSESQQSSPDDGLSSGLSQPTAGLSLQPPSTPSQTQLLQQFLASQGATARPSTSGLGLPNLPIPTSTLNYGFPNIFGFGAPASTAMLFQPTSRPLISADQSVGQSRPNTGFGTPETFASGQTSQQAAPSPDQEGARQLLSLLQALQPQRQQFSG